jgi:hypothetical protein
LEDSLVESPSASKLNYTLMFEQSNLGNIIREKALEIEENMRMVSPHTHRNIDMKLIESLKQRRKESER